LFIEEFLVGEEASIFAVTDGEDYIILPPSQDHKRIYDGDKGKNTGGMGAYAPAPIIDDNMMRIIERKIVSKTIEALRKENKSYSGCLYCGLMITDTGPQLIEYNCRFGDPETQVVLPIIEGDFLELLDSTARGKLNIESIEYKNSSAVCVIAASKGYPDKYEKGFEIEGLNNISEDNIIVYHAGTKLLEDKVVTNGGRVLGVTARYKKL
jgi:phosphoribosylamine--glycine ligase